jgi:transposase
LTNRLAKSTLNPAVTVAILAEAGPMQPSYDELQRENEDLRRRLGELEATVAELTRLLDEARRAGKRQAAPFRKGEPKPAPKRPGRKAGDAHGRHGHRPPPDPIHETYDAPLPGACPACGGPVAETDVVRQYQTEIPRQPLHRQFTIHVGACQNCGRRVQGRHPLQTSDALGAAASQLGPDAQAATVLLNKQAGLSHGKVAACFQTLFGIDLTRGASAQINLRAAERLEPAYQAILQATRGASVLTADETGWRIGGHPAWLHVWVGEQATCYAIDPQRGAAVLEQVIGSDWDGTLVHDGWAPYDRFTAAWHQQCVAHVLRRARELLAEATRGAVRFPRQVIALFTEAVHLRNRQRAGSVSAARLHAARELFEERLLRLVAADRAVPAYETLAGHLWNHFESWFTFLSDPTVPATNYQAEQAIRPAVVNRKVWGGNRTATGAAAQAVLMSVLQTCTQQTQAALDFVSSTLRAFGNSLLTRPVLLPTR